MKLDLSELDKYDNIDLAKEIDRCVRGERNREILKRRLIDEICYEPLSEEFDLSVQHTKDIVYKSLHQLFSHI